MACDGAGEETMTIYEHLEKKHPRRIWWIVRNLSGTVHWCCVGDCNWKSQTHGTSRLRPRTEEEKR